jgi:hypothetical protein
MGLEPQGSIIRPEVHYLGGAGAGEEHRSPQGMLPYTYCIFGLDTHRQWWHGDLVNIHCTMTLDEFCELCLELG